MDLNLIKKPVITEKSKSNSQFNKYIFEVRNDANKINIKNEQIEVKDLKVKVVVKPIIKVDLKKNVNS